MKWKKIRTIALFTMVIVLGAAVSGFAAGSVEWSILKTLQLDAALLDVAITRDGRRIFVLTDQGEIFIYSSTTKLEAKIEAGKHVDQIKF